MANVDVSVLESDGVTTKTVRTLDFGRQAAAASKSLTLSTEDKAVLDSLATKLDTAITALQIIDNMVLAAGSATIGKVGLNDGTNAITFTDAAVSASAFALPVIQHPDGQNANGRAAAASSTPVVLSTEDKTALDAAVTAVQLIDNAISGSEMQVDVVGALPAGEAHVGEVGGKTAVVSVTLSTDTSAYASGDLIADTQQIDAFFRKTDGTGVINSITIIDEDNQGAAFYIVFMSTSTSLGTENSAPNISDANLTAGLQGIIAVATSDYVTLSGAKVATIKNIGLPVKAVSGTDDIYIAVLNATGTPTYTASGLEMRIGVLLD